MLRRLPTLSVICALLCCTAYGWVVMGDNVPSKLRLGAGLRPAIHATHKEPHKRHTAPAPAHAGHLGTRAKHLLLPAGALPVATLRWISLRGEALDQDGGELDLATDTLSPPEGAWSDVEITLADGAWLTLDGEDQDLSGQTLTVALADPEAADPLWLDLPQGADLDAATLISP